MKCTCEKRSVFQEPEVKTKITSGLSEIKNVGGWFTLYKCAGCNSFWEKHYPQGEYHGGGPAELRKVSTEYAKEKYSVGA